MAIQTKTLRLIAIVLVIVVALGAAAFGTLKYTLMRADERNLERIAALEALVRKAVSEHGGEVVGSVLDDMAGRPVYELMLRTADGRTMHLKYDLQSGEEVFRRDLPQ